jgi:hypothetical protein
MSVCVITVRYSTPVPSPYKPAPEIVRSGQSVSEAPAEVRLFKHHTVGGGGPLPGLIAVRSRERVPSSCHCNTSRNTYGGYQIVRCYNSCA